MNRSIATLMAAVSLLLVGGVVAQEDDEPYGPQPMGGPVAQKQYEENIKTYKGNPDVLVLPGLVANRKERTVEVLVECTGLSGGDVAEFLLIDQHSSHGYEGLLWSFAKPSDVHAALVFIGLRPGAPFDPRAMRFFASGDPVILNVRNEEGGEFRIEELIQDTETGESLPLDGFIFAGSIMVPLREGQPPDAPRYAADLYDPRSVASVYNEPTAVLDVPRMVQKGEAYGSQVVNPELVCEGGTLLTVVMTPGEDEDGAPRRRELTLSLAGADEAGAAAFRLATASDKVLHEGGELAPLLKVLTGQLREMPEGQSIFMEFSLAENTPLGVVPKVSAVLAVLESLSGIMVKPPPEGQLYYRAYVPDRDWLEPVHRPTQPWELHLSRHEKTLTGRMVMNQAVWTEGKDAPTFTRTEVAVATPEAVRAQLDADAKARQEAGRAAAPAALLVYVEPSMTVGEMMAFLRPVQSTHGAVYVFVEE